MAGVSLTAGMRANLFNLQMTAKLMEQTAVRLNTGKKVNSALDDPTSYFTARAHMSRVADLGTLKNGMSEGIQTITAANNGIEAIISLIEAAKAKAESAKSADAGGGGDTTGTITLNGVTENNTITIGGTLYTATSAGSTGFEFEVGATDSLTAMSLATLINSNVEGTNIDATSVSGSQINIELTLGGNMVASNVEIISPTFSEALITASTDRDALVDQYAELMRQIDQLKADSGYKGINLLEADDTLTVKFEGTNKIDVEGFDGDVAGLSLNATAGNDAGWGDNSLIDDDITKMDSAISQLESAASSLASSLSIVTTRQDFTENMINTLTSGADSLILADMNEEGANMLMLQTQQALGTTSLSMAAQTAQSVLRLF